YPLVVQGVSRVSVGSGLVSSRHRLTMCQLAVQSSDWIRSVPLDLIQFQFYGFNV
uniref:Uncharacterized protein n=1 Tax=Sphaeramia orbicularis TaxID=375764 RepID=A0A672Z2N2_9TELE